MNKLQSQIKAIAKNLTSIADKLEKLNAQIGKETPKKAAKAAPAKKKAVSKPSASKPVASKKPAKKAPAKKEAPAAADKNTVLESVLDVIAKSRNGSDIASLKSKTGLESRQLSNALYKLSKKGQIKTVSRGVYVKA